MGWWWTQVKHSTDQEARACYAATWDLCVSLGFQPGRGRRPGAIGGGAHEQPSSSLHCVQFVTTAPKLPYGRPIETASPAFSLPVRSIKLCGDAMCSRVHRQRRTWGTGMAEAGSIFLNYRREESQWVAGRLYDRLAAAFGKDRIFTDVDSIAPGQDFTKVLEDTVGNCRVLLAIIGRNWTNALDEAGRRRLENPHDWVRFEIETALSGKGVLVVPVLTDNAPMPRTEELPGELARLSMRQAVNISADAFTRDVEMLIDLLKKTFDHPARRRLRPRTHP